MGPSYVLTPLHARIILLLSILLFYQTSISFGQSITSSRCGTTSLLSSFQSTEGLGLASYQSDGFHLTRPSVPGESGRTGFGHTYTTTPTFYNSPGGHFKIWYVTTTPDRPGAGRPTFRFSSIWTVSSWSTARSPIPDSSCGRLEPV